MSNTIKSRFEISADELESRIEKKKKLHDEPIQKAVAILQEALEIVLRELGIDTEQESEMVKEQQEMLGITIWEHTEESNPQLNGFYIHNCYDSYMPYAWVGAARLNHLGECFCDIQWYQKDKLSEIGGVKLVQ